MQTIASPDAHIVWLHPNPIYITTLNILTILIISRKGKPKKPSFPSVHQNMISLHTPKQILSEESLSKKRKIWDDQPQDTSDQKQQKVESTNFIFDLKNRPQFPQEWQQCLDIKSGQIYFYNTRTKTKRATLEGYNNDNHPAPMSLELELNLPCQSLGKHHDFGTTSVYSNNHFTSSTKAGPTRSPSWLTIERDEQQEMVTAVCRKCYMLVMMCKSSPTCPNCKFMHPIMEPISHPFNQ